MIATTRSDNEWLKIVLFGFFLAAMSLLQGCSDSSLTDAEYLAKAKDSQDKGDYQATIIDLKNALRLNGGNREARWLLGTIYVETGAGPAAEKELRRAQELGVSSEAIAVPLAKALLLQAKFRELLENIPVLQSLSPDAMAELYFLRGKAFVGLGELDKATEAFKTASRSKEDSTAAWLGQALLALIDRQWDKATEWVNKALVKAPASIDAIVLKGDIALAQGEFGGAEEAYQMAVDAIPGMPQYRVALAIAQVNLGKLDKAIAHLKLVLKVFPNDVMSNYYRAVAAYKKADFEGAVVYSEKVLDATPRHLPSHMLAAAANYASNHIEQANKHVQAVLAVAPSYIPARKLLAATQLRLGLVDEAAANVKDVTAKSEEDIRLLEAIGAAALYSGQAGVGRDLLGRVAQMQPGSGVVMAELGLASLSLGERERGVDELEKAIDLDPKFVAAQVALIMNHLQADEYDKALQAAQYLQETHPENPDGFTLAGVAYAAKGGDKDAKALFAKALEVKPGDPNASINLASYALRDGNREEARSLYNQVLKQHPGHLRTLLLLANLESQSGHPRQALARLEEAAEKNPDALQPHVLLGQAYLAMNDPIKAIAVSQQGLRQHQDNPALLGVLGRAQLQMGQYADAVHSLQAATKVRPDELASHYYLAIAYERLGQVDRANQELQAALKINPTHAPSKFARAGLLVRQGKLDGAEALLMELRSAATADDPAMAELEGKIALARKHPQEAAGLFQKALQTRKNNVLIIQLAAAQFQAGDKDASDETLRKWLEEYPEDILTRSTYADSLLALNQLPQAKRQYSEIVRRMPGNVLARNNLAWVLFKSGAVDEALPHAKRAYELAPQVPQVLDTYGVVLLDKGRAEEAATLFRSAMEKAPNDLNLRFHLAQALAGSGDVAESEKILRGLLDNAGFTGHEKAQALLKELELR